MKIEFDSTNPEEVAALTKMFVKMHNSMNPANPFKPKVYYSKDTIYVDLTKTLTKFGKKH